jgi:glucokinase
MPVSGNPSVAVASIVAQKRPHRRLLADIGGTNARFAWQSVEDSALTHVDTLKCADFSTVNDAITHYLSQQRLPSPDAFAFGVATPVNDDVVKMTNHHWSFSVSALKRELDCDTGLVINDFVALASAIPAMTAADLNVVNAARQVSGAPIAVIGAGTGLGVASLVADDEGRYHAVPGEGGHVTLAATNETEEAIIRLLREKFGHVSAERALSGPGIVSLYEAHCALRGETPALKSASAITQHAQSHWDSSAYRAISSFTDFLGNVSGNLALTLGAFGGLYIGGGIVPKLGELFDRKRFLAAFGNKGRFANYLADVPCFIITCPSPALLGASRVLQQHVDAAR